MPNIHEPLLVNTIGHSAGAVIFGIFLILFLRDRAGSRFLRGSWLSFAAAALAFLWDVGSLAAIVAGTSNVRNGDILIAFSFAMLSMLPAVLLHLALDGSFPWLIGTGYVLSSLSSAMHGWELAHPEDHARHTALVLIPVGFGILTAASAVMLSLRKAPQSRGNNSRIIGAMCLFLFAISFIHFGSSTPDRGWSSELLIHHAGIPLALFVLLQDYRFVMLDAFVRFLANVMLAGLLTFAVIRTGLKLVLVETHGARNPLYEALLLTALCLLLIGFSLVRNRVQKLLTNVVFRRPMLEQALQTIRSGSGAEQNEAQYLSWATEKMAAFMDTERGEMLPEQALPDVLRSLDLVFPTPVSDCPDLRGSERLAWAEAVIPLRFSLGDVRYSLLGRRRGGRRYLSEDLSFLARVTAAIVDQIERLRSIEVQRLVSQAELRALQAQINPHFLFNALNTLYGIIPRENAGARKTVLNLAEIFRYFLQSEKTFIPLKEELQIVRAYLEIERLRLGPRLQTAISVDDGALDVPIPILCIQPLVENAVKHGIAANPQPGLLCLNIERRGGEVKITVHDTGAGIGGTAPDNSGAGVGLSNVSRRLQLCFGKEFDLSVAITPAGTTVSFSLPAGRGAVGASPLQDLPDAVSLPLAND
jgi:two-component system LytT family sensor kinase